MNSNTLSSVPIFAPTQISGCSLWLDAADSSSMAFSGTTITTWRDKSGNGYLATGVNNPSYISSSNGINFINTSSQYFTLSDNCFPINDSSYSYFYIFTPRSTTANQTLTFGGSNNGTAGDFGKSCALRTGDLGTGTLQAYWFSYDLQTSNTYTTNVKNFAATYYTSGSTRSIWINYIQGASDTPGTRSQRANMNIIGAAFLGGSVTGFLDGLMHEIIVYNSALSTFQRQQVEGYLAWKWGLQSSLPANHPYRNTPVYPITSLPSQFRSLGTIPMASSSSPFSFFNPASISNCQLWLDGADPNTITLSTGVVTTWRDKSGNGYNATQATGSATYVSNGIVFTGSQAFQTSLSSVNNTQSFFAIISYNTSAYVDIIGPNTTGTNPGYQYVINTNVQNVARYAGPTVMTGGTMTQNTTLMYEATVNGGSTSYLYLNGTQTGSGVSTPSVSGTGTVLIGGYKGVLFGELFSGTIYEIVLYYTILSTTQRQQIEGYLAWKWGLAGNLPSNHPFKNNPPGLAIPVVPPRLTMNTGFFRPTSIANCKLWLDAADSGTVIRSGSNVTQWTDKSGSGYNATQANASYYATYSNNSIVFNGSSSYLQISNPAIRPTNAYVIVQSAAATGHVYRKGYGSPGTFETALRYDTSNIQTLYNTTTDTLATAQYTAGVTASRVLLEATWNGTTIILYVNGTSRATASLSGSQKVASTGVTDMRIGAEFSSESNSSTPFAGTLWNGTMNEIVMFSTSLTTAQRQQMEGYLAWKWGIQGSLPATHPYKKWPPPPS